MAAVERGDVRARAPVAVHDAAGPAALRAAARSTGCGWAPPCWLQRRGDRAPFERVTARAWIERWMGKAAWREVWGPMLRGKFGARADEIAMVWLWSKLRLRRGEDAREERLGYPRRLVGAAVRGAARADRGRGGRVLIDRPAVRIEPGLEVTFGAPGSFRAGHDPRAFEPAGAERYDRVLATVPNDVFARLTGLPEPPIEYFAALCLLLELDRPFTRFYWTNVADRELPFVGLIEHTNFVEPERYDGPPLPLRRQLPRARARAAGRSTPTPCSSATCPACGGEPGVRPLVGGEPVAAPRAGRAADRHRRVPRAHPAAEDIRPGPRARQHHAGLSRGPRHQLRGPARRARRRGRRSSDRARRRRRRHVHRRGARLRRRHGHRQGAEHGEPGGGRGGGGARGAGARRRRARRRDALRARLDGRHQRAAHAQRRPHRARHHQGLPRPAVPRPPGAARASTGCTRRRRRRWSSGACAWRSTSGWGPTA